MILSTTASKALSLIASALALAACAEEEPAYEADATDVSGGELIVTEQTPAVDVDLPETPMTPVPEGETTAQGEGAEEAVQPSAE